MVRTVFVLYLFISVFYAQKSPTLMAREFENEKAPYQPVQLKSVLLEVNICGTFAETTMVLVFHNSSESDKEGEFILPLPEGSTISGYALDIGEQIVDGVIVEKHVARTAFEREKRKKIDPGLVEWIQGNHFRSRIYPILANGDRRIWIKYLSSLVSTSTATLYQLPLYFEASEAFKLRISVLEAPSAPVARSQTVGVSFKKQENSYIAEIEDHQKAFKETMEIEINTSFPKIEVEKESETVYFSILDKPEIQQIHASKIQPRQIGLYWDASFSRKKTPKEKEFQLLETLCQAWKDVTIDVLVFRNQLEPPKTIQIQKGSAELLIQYLKEIPYDGGTQFSALTFLQKQTAENNSAVYDFALLFSDGFQTLGKIEKQFPTIPLYIVNSESQANPLFLRALAESSGGNYFDLTSQPIQEVANQVGALPFAFLGAVYDASQIADLCPSGRQNVSAGFELTGKLLTKEATILLQYGYGSQVTHQRKMTLSQKDAIPSSLLSKFWAQKKIMELALYPETNHSALLELGQRFGMVTPGTSLMVLETLEQYLEYNIKPPYCLVGVRNEWLEIMDRREQEKKDNLENKTNQLVEEWNERVEWWNRDFSQWKNNVEFSEKESEESEDSDSSVGSAMFAEPTPEPQIDIALKPWDPETPYLGVLKIATQENRAYQSYLDLRDGYYSRNSAFYLDCANFFWKRGEDAIALRILTTILELKLESPELLRLVAYRLNQEEKELDLTILLLEEVLRMRQEEPQSYRDLALSLAKRGEREWNKNPERAKPDLERALQLFHQILFSTWDARFYGISGVVLMEMNRLLALVDRFSAQGPVTISKPLLDPRLCKLLDVDLRIVVTWDSNQTDIDLHIIEPTKEKCYYSNPETAIGGHLSRDLTGGYGPEEYCLRRLISGVYKIKVNYYGDNSEESDGPIDPATVNSRESDSPVAPVTVKATIYANYGRPNEQFQEVTLRLDQVSDLIEVGSVALFNIQRNSENLLNQHLFGSWKIDPMLTSRLNENRPLKTFSSNEVTFLEDLSTTKMIPEEYANTLSEKSIFFTGKMLLNQTEYPFLLIESKGNLQILYFDNEKKAQTFHVSMAHAFDPQKSLLFLGTNPQEMVAFERVR